MDDKYSNLNYQNLTFNSVYNKYTGINGYYTTIGY